MPYVVRSDFEFALLCGRIAIIGNYRYRKEVQDG